MQKHNTKTVITTMVVIVVFAVIVALFSGDENVSITPKQDVPATTTDTKAKTPEVTEQKDEVKSPSAQSNAAGTIDTTLSDVDAVFTESDYDDTGIDTLFEETNAADLTNEYQL